MANVTISIPDAVVTRVQEAFASAYQYSATLEDGSPNSETKQQFFRRQVLRFIKETVVAYETNQAAEASRKTAQIKAEQEIQV